MQSICEILFHLIRLGKYHAWKRKLLARVNNRKNYLEKMPEISVRGLEMPESPIRKLAPLAAAAKKRGVKVYHLNIGQPDLPTPQCGLDALKHIDRTILE